jgi:hypothetical protein
VAFEIMQENRTGKPEAGRADPGGLLCDLAELEYELDISE